MTEKRHRSIRTDRFATYDTQVVPDGADIRIVPRGPHRVWPEVEADGDSVVVRLRRDLGPRVGEQVMVGRTHVTVAEKRFGADGTLMLMDADTRAWVPWKREGDR